MKMRAAPSIALLAVLLACAEQPETPRPNIVIIAVDTLRADRLPFYRPSIDTAPFLSEVAARSTVFENAWSPSSWTLPAAVSALTSVHPFQHGVTNLVGLELESEEEPVPVVQVPAEVETLAEILAAEGYRNYGIVSNILLGSEIGIDRGFDRFVRLADEDADVVNEVLRIWRTEIVAAEPYFLYLHYFDPHDPLHAREPWFDPGRPTSETGWSAEFSEASPHSDDLEWFRERVPPLPDGLARKAVDEYTPEDTGRFLAWSKAAYDSEVRYLDSRIREVFKVFDLKDAIVVFLADHGEEFYEHGHLTHGQNLYWETMRVPLFIQLPGEAAPGRRSVPHVSTLDIVPTLRALLGLPPSDQDRGQDLFSDSARGPVIGMLEGKSGQHALDTDLRSIIVGDYRLIAERGGGAELYDLSLDPLERNDLAAELPRVVEDLLRELDRIEGSSPRYTRLTEIPERPGEAMMEHLKGLGYLN